MASSDILFTPKELMMSVQMASLLHGTKLVVFYILFSEGFDHIENSMEEMSMLRRSLSAVIAAIMTFTVLPVGVRAEEEPINEESVLSEEQNSAIVETAEPQDEVRSSEGKAYAVLTDGDDLIFFRSNDTYENESTGTFTDINGNEYTGTVYSGIETLNASYDTDIPWYSNRVSIKSSIVADGQKIAPVSTAYWFCLCIRLTSLDVSGFDTSNATNMINMFSNCTDLRSLDLSGFDTGNVKSMSYMFINCTDLTSLDVSSFDTSNVKSMASMFSHCSSLTSLDVSGFDTSNVISMEGMFDNCTNLTSLDVSGFDTSNVMMMGRMFENCSSLNRITLGIKFTNWIGNSYLPAGTWKNGELAKTETELYDEYPSHAEEWAGTWKKEGLGPESIQLNKTEASLKYGSTLSLEAIIKPDDAEDKNVTWESAEEKIASVNSNGQVTAKGVGVTTITARTSNNLTATCTIRVLFTDVADSKQYFFEPVYWAFENGITVGAGGPGKFSPRASCTREQFVTFLWRLKGQPKATEGCDFADVPKDAWYYDPISWAAENGITTGLNDGTNRFGVGQACTREQCVTFLHRAADTPEPTGSIEFTDSEEGRYYYKAIKWAAGKGITVGLNDGTGRFGVGQKCTRGMLVTFLSRYAHAE